MRTNPLKRLLRTIFLLPVYGYRLFISPILKPSCLYSPTCSNYMLQAVKKHGILKGFALGFLRIGRCHGFFTGGDDPVPETVQWKEVFGRYKEFRHTKETHTHE